MSLLWTSFKSVFEFTSSLGGMRITQLFLSSKNLGPRVTEGPSNLTRSGSNSVEARDHMYIFRLAVKRLYELVMHKCDLKGLRGPRPLSVWLYSG